MRQIGRRALFHTVIQVSRFPPIYTSPSARALFSLQWLKESCTGSVCVFQCWVQSSGYVDNISLEWGSFLSLKASSSFRRVFAIFCPEFLGIWGRIWDYPVLHISRTSTVIETACSLPASTSSLSIQFPTKTVPGAPTAPIKLIPLPEMPPTPLDLIP